MKHNEKIWNSFQHNDQVRITRKYISIPTGFDMLTGKYRKYRPYFAYGNKPNITQPHAVIYTFWVCGIEFCYIQNTKTFQVYLVLADGLKIW